MGGLLLKNYRAALLYDAVYVFAQAVEALSNGTEIESPPQVKCEDPDAPFEMGRQFMEAIGQVGTKFNSKLKILCNFRSYFFCTVY